MTKQTKLKKGEEFWCVHPRIPKPMKGKIISLTTNKSKMIGLEFTEKLSIFHDCDGRGPKNSCLWVRPKDILTNEEYSEVKKIKEKAAEHAKRIEAEDLEELDINSEK